jgi:hypothetical protein
VAQTLEFCPSWEPVSPVNFAFQPFFLEECLVQEQFIPRSSELQKRAFANQPRRESAVYTCVLLSTGHSHGVNPERRSLVSLFEGSPRMRWSCPRGRGLNRRFTPASRSGICAKT